MITCIFFGLVIFGLKKFDYIIGTLTEPQNLGVERFERMSSYHQRQEVDAIIRDTIDKVPDFSCSALAALQIPSASNLMTLYATVPPLSLFLSFYCSRNFEACELNLFLSTQLSKSPREVSKFASVALVDIDFDEIQVYVKFDIAFIPSTVFFFNAHHMKMDSGYV